MAVNSCSDSTSFRDFVEARLLETLTFENHAFNHQATSHFVRTFRYFRMIAQGAGPIIALHKRSDSEAQLVTSMTF